MDENNQEPKRFKKAITILAVIGATIIAASMIIAIIALSVTGNIIYSAIILKHYPVTIGLPMAAIAALVLVFLLEYARGAIEFEVPGVKFKGASGPLVLWVFVYLAIVSSISLLWDDVTSYKVIDTMFEEKLKTSILKEQYERCQLEKSIQHINMKETQKLCAAELINKSETVN